jgi:hypothetical protein
MGRKNLLAKEISIIICSLFCILYARLIHIAGLFNFLGEVNDVTIFGGKGSGNFLEIEVNHTMLYYEVLKKFFI